MMRTDSVGRLCSLARRLNADDDFRRLPDWGKRSVFDALVADHMVPKGLRIKRGGVDKLIPIDDVPEAEIEPAAAESTALATVEPVVELAEVRRRWWQRKRQA